jgi:hypothetical protein
MRSLACARAPASSTAKLSPATRAECRGFSRISHDPLMKAPDLGCRGFVDNSPLISCEGVGERHLFFIQRPLTVGVCAKLLTRHEKSWPGSDRGRGKRLSALLRARRERPRHRRAAEQRDELATFQFDRIASVPASQGRIVGYRMGRDQSAVIGVLAKPVSAPLGHRSRNEVE